MAEEKKTETEEKPGNLPEEVTKVLEEIKSKLSNPPPPKEEPPAAPSAPSYADRREALRKSLGFSEEQMQAHESMIRQNQGPVQETLGWTKLEKKSDIDTFRKEIESELSFYPMEQRTPAIMEKIYFYVKGKHADSKPSSPAPKAKTSDGRVADTRVSRGPGYTGAEPGLNTGDTGPGATEEDKLDDREKFVAAKLAVSEADYMKSKKVGREIRELRVPDTRQAQSMADIELKRLTNR